VDWEERITIRLRWISLCLTLLVGLAGCGLGSNRPPVAIIEVSSDRGNAPFTVHFDASNSSDIDSRIVRYLWDFGDGTEGRGPVVTHTYQSDGVYLVELNIIDEYGNVDSDRTRIVVGSPPPQAIFTTSLATGWAPLTVSFDGTASFDPAGRRISMYEWDFGDGFRTTGEAVSHTYTKSGQYSVELTITDRGGTSNSSMRPIHVIDLKSGRDLRAGRSPTSIVAKDMDGDGTVDLAVANSQSNDITVYFGQAGNLLFPNSIRIPVGERPVSLDSADFNGDDLPDIAVASFDSGVVTILLNEGGRHFRESEGIAVGQWISGVVTEDFNRDGIFDIAATDSGEDRVHVLLGNGSGEFTVNDEIAVGDGPEGLAAGDFDLDGRVDLAVIHFLGDTVEILYGNGLGRFHVGNTIPVGRGPTSIKTGYFNDDDRLDLIVANTNSSTVSVLLGTHDGGFIESQAVAAGRGVRSAGFADFDADGTMDIASANTTADSVSVMLNDGFNQFIVERTKLFAEGRSPTALVVDDFDDDGFPDIAIVHFDDDKVTVLLNQL